MVLNIHSKEPRLKESTYLRMFKNTKITAKSTLKPQQDKEYDTKWRHLPTIN